MTIDNYLVHLAEVIHVTRRGLLKGMAGAAMMTALHGSEHKPNINIQIHKKLITPQITVPGIIVPKTREQIEAFIDQESKKYPHIPYMNRLYKSMVHNESEYNPNAKSDQGAIGLAQLMPITAKEMNVKDRKDPIQSITGGMGYVNKLHKRYNGNIKHILSAYNQGPTNHDKRMKLGKRIPKETIIYQKRVLTTMRDMYPKQK